VPSRKRLERLGKTKELLCGQNGGSKKSKIATKVRSRIEVLKRDKVKIVLV
jgi:hypothetical protein